MSTLKNYWTVRHCVEELLLAHLEQEWCQFCLINLEKFKEFVNHHDLTAEDLVTDPTPEYNFNECPVWRRIRRPLTECEAFMTDEEIEDMVKAGKSMGPTEAEFFRCYLQESRKSALNLVQN